MKTFILLFAFLFSCTKTETKTTETPTEKTRYDDRGLPKDRDYLTRSEWKGSHITDKRTKKRFKEIFCILWKI